MKVVPLDSISLGMRLGQNIYRNDGLLALPKGAVIHKRERDTLRFHQLEFVLILEENDRYGTKENDLNTSLNILESAYKKCSLWDEAFGDKLYENISRKILKKKKLQKYINKLRTIDSYSYAHCINVSMVVASLLHVHYQVDEHLSDLVLLALLHDIGRIKLDNIFNKDGKLNGDEFEQLKKHPILSYNMLKGLGFSKHELKFVVETHENWDGSGYPAKLEKEEISELAQLIFIADVYNALSSYRPYRGIYAPYDIVQIIEGEKNKMFGESYIAFFLDRFMPYPVGTKVELNNGHHAVVVKVREGKKMLPLVETVCEKTGERIELIDLSQHQGLRILRINASY
ncbi:HD domain-containing protein (plasmid) [Pontibacillus sp. ALD_SL1]|uniref:HD-GYP domain-containing protein n=1 Tax=Pontibacillus sp. ALD_SL1 TaxID=2777185 RepID=UPI001A95FCB6|nr:HD domain-containing phosphohydrolase [Pontibacillus sp. ALD_SL1]QST03064.1 HD domain-containing protein [Pontibacillus sp. ALD_SL1]